MAFPLTESGRFLAETGCGGIHEGRQAVRVGRSFRSCGTLPARLENASCSPCPSLTIPGPCAGTAAVRKEEEFLLHNGEKDSIMFLAVRLVAV